MSTDNSWPMDVIEGRVSGRPALIHMATKRCAFLPEAFQLIKTDRNIIGAFDLKALRLAELHFYPIALGDSVEVFISDPRLWPSPNDHRT